MTWHASKDNWYTPNSQDAIDNATEAANILINDFGWSQAACCGLFGNIDYEGRWNPWSWQGTGSPENGALTRTQAQNEHGSSHGYGLIGWTPSGKYQFNDFATSGGVVYFPGYDQESYPGYAPYFKNEENVASATDGAAQIRLIATAMANQSPNIWVRRSNEPYNYTSTEYIQLTDPELAAKTWLWRAERPSSIFDPDTRPRTESNRSSAARQWSKRLDWDLPASPNKIIIYKRIIDHSRGFL